MLHCAIFYVSLSIGKKPPGQFCQVCYLTSPVSPGYADAYPFLRNNKSYKALLIYAYVFESYTKFSQNAEVDGYAYMKKAESAMKSDWTSMPLLDQMIGLMYAEAGAYHFRKKQYTKAKEILLEGLKVAPNHSEINARLEIVEDENMRPSRP